jgi:type II secretory pathway predicted ATPase ExeA
MTDLTQAVLNGDRRALARLITLVENDTGEGQQALDGLFRDTGKAHVIGVTGASGAGKSSLVNCLVEEILKREPDKSVAVIAVDPTSPLAEERCWAIEYACAPSQIIHTCSFVPWPAAVHGRLSAEYAGGFVGAGCGRL